MNKADTEQLHKRRPHYSGKYPKKFEEKYKELQPDKYSETVEHVKKKGITPAGMHVPICVNEILSFFDIKENQHGLDCTLGYGGHTQKMLECLNHTGLMVSLDVDPIESAKTEARIRKAGYTENEFRVIRTNFKNIDLVVQETGKFDFILADLGVSSMQIDDPSRGFSFREDGPLDLRLDPTAGKSGAQRLKEMEAAEIEGMLVENADEEYAAEISKAIYSAERRGGIETTGQLREVIRKALWKLPKEEQDDAVKKSCKRCFQALRIDVNREFEVLEELIRKLPDALNPGGKAAVLTFHSGEDRIVKKMFQMQKGDGLYKEIAKDVIRPGAEECFDNPRARSAKLRWAVRA